MLEENAGHLYILPRMLYGLEALIVSPKQKEMVEASFRQMLKQIQSLPQRTANEVPYILFGILPAEALLDIKTLIFHNNITDHDSILTRSPCVSWLPNH